jgi:hypothetical protein
MRVLHLRVESPLPVDFAVKIQVDFTGIAGHVGDAWNDYATVAFDGVSYMFHVFPSGFSAHWVRLVPSASVTITATFHYT